MSQEPASKFLSKGNILREPEGLWDRREHPARCRTELPGMPAISPAAAYLIAAMGFRPTDIVKNLRRSPDAPCFQADLDSLSENTVNGAAVVFNPLDVDVILLQVWRQSLWYTETGHGEAILSILGHSLPETVCARAAVGDLKISDIIEADESAFFAQGNPRVISLSNERAGRYQALTIEMQIAFDLNNWRPDPASVRVSSLEATTRGRLAGGSDQPRTAEYLGIELP